MGREFADQHLSDLSGNVGHSTYTRTPTKGPRRRKPGVVEKLSRHIVQSKMESLKALHWHKLFSV